MHFPRMVGTNLQRRKVVIPDELQGQANVVIIAFRRSQQEEVESWTPFLQGIERACSGLRYYELPTVRPMDAVSRVFISEGMRASIRDEAARERTITIHIDTRAFCQALDLPDESTIHVLLLDDRGQVRWSADGRFTPEKGLSLQGAINELAGHCSGQINGMDPA